MKAPKYFFYTVDMLKANIAKKTALWSKTKSKLDAYDKDIRELENELDKRYRQ